MAYLAFFKKEKNLKTIGFSRLFRWSGLRDLNPRSLGPKPSAIPNFAKPGYSIFSVAVKHVVKGPCSREFAREEGAETFGFTRDSGLSDFSRTWGVLHAPKRAARPLVLLMGDLYAARNTRDSRRLLQRGGNAASGYRFTQQTRRRGA